MSKARIIMAVNPGVFREFAASVKFGLESFGIPTEIYENENDVSYGEHYDLNFVIKALRDYPEERRITGPKILLQTEELWNRRENGHYDLSKGYDRVLEMYDENVAIPSGTYNVVYCPVGYSPVWETHLPDVEEDIDILFHGSLTDRRMTFEKALAEKGYNIIFTCNAYGLERDALIKRSKIVINIKAFDKWSYGPMHTLPTQANKKFMLSEKADGGYGPFRAGIHMQEYDGVDDCLEKVAYWLEHEKERKEFSISAYEDMVKTCDYTEILREALGPQKRMGSLL